MCLKRRFYVMECGLSGFFYGAEYLVGHLRNPCVAQGFHGFCSPPRKGDTSQSSGKPIISTTYRGLSRELPPPILWAIYSARLLVSAFGLLCLFRLSIVMVVLFPSDALGVGSSPIFAARAIVGRALAFGDWDLFIRPLPLSVAVTVGNNPHSVPAVGRADGTSRNNKRLDGVSFTLKTRADGLKGKLLSEEYSFSVNLSEQSETASQRKLLAGLYHREDSSNVFTNDPSGPDFANGAQHLRPEVAVIVRSASLSGAAERLAGESAGKHVDASAPRGKVCGCDVFITCRVWVMVFQNFPAEGVDFTVEEVLPPHPRGGKLGSAYAAEKAGVGHGCIKYSLHINPLRGLKSLKSHERYSSLRSTQCAMSFCHCGMTWRGLSGSR